MENMENMENSHRVLTWVGHSSIETGSVATGLTSGSLPLDPRLVVDNPHIAPIVVGADVRLVLDDHNRSLEEILAAGNICIAVMTVSV